MNIIEKTKEEGERFVDFAPILDRTGRSYLVMWLQQKLLSDTIFHFPIKSSYLVHFAEVLENIFAHPELQKILDKQPLFGHRLFTETLHWLRQSFKNIEKTHPFETEENHLDGWAVRPLSNLKTQWAYLCRDAENYTEGRSSFVFHRGKFKELSEEGHDEKWNRVINDVLAIWDADLQGRILRYQLDKWSEETQEFAENLNQKVEEMAAVEKIVGPFVDFLDPDWSLDKSALEDTGFDVLETYHQWLKDEKSLEELANMLGKLRKAQIETQEEVYEEKLIYQEEVRDPTLRNELDGVHTGKDLARILPSESVLFSDEETEWHFYKKYSEDKLMQYHFRDRQFIQSTDVLHRSREKNKRKQKGPFIVCVDTSGSMEGEPERLAKILCFGILKMAAKENRPAYLINFSTGIQSIDLRNIASNLGELVRFLRMSFHGGTDVTLALSKTLETLESNTYRDADVLVISDFVMYEIGENVKRKMRRQQQHFDTKFYCLVIGEQANPEQLKVFDQSWLYNPEEKGVYREIEEGFLGIQDSSYL
jgi:uncharacterized protein with von Willebrand factor type A (vWA) domain